MDDQILLTRVGETVRALRKRRGWTRRELAGHAGISERFLADIETGRANPSLLRLCRLAEALGLSVTGLLSSSPPPSAPARSRVVSLLGLRGAGKSTVGAALAQRLGCPFVELDARVEQRAGASLAELFEMHGEVYYRRLEREVLESILREAGDSLVLATGGGIVTERETFALLERQTHTVWLRAEPEDHWTRVVAQGDTRPMADDDRAFANLCAILAERERLYQQADYVVDTSRRSVADIVDELALRFAFLAREDTATGKDRRTASSRPERSS